MVNKSIYLRELGWNVQLKICQCSRLYNYAHITTEEMIITIIFCMNILHNIHSNDMKDNTTMIRMVIVLVIFPNRMYAFGGVKVHSDVTEI